MRTYAPKDDHGQPEAAAYLPCRQCGRQQPIADLSNRGGLCAGCFAAYCSEAGAKPQKKAERRPA